MPAAVTVSSVLFGSQSFHAVSPCEKSPFVTKFFWAASAKLERMSGAAIAVERMLSRAGFMREAPVVARFAPRVAGWLLLPREAAGRVSLARMAVPGRRSTVPCLAGPSRP